MSNKLKVKYKPVKSTSLIPDHDMWFQRARSFGYELVSESDFSQAPSWAQDKYISSIRSVISQHRNKQDNAGLDFAMTQADFICTNLKSNLILLLSEFADLPQAQELLDALKFSVLNSTTIYKHNQLILRALKFLSVQRVDKQRFQSVQQLWSQSIELQQQVELFIPSQTPLVVKQNIWQRIRSTYLDSKR